LYVLFDIEIRTGDSHSILDMSGNRINPSSNVVIGNHVWVGSRVIILKGAQISDFSIIGAGSIVSGEFPDTNVILAGVPAKIVKDNINWKRERI
jgi:acetyltransferase-like isoleucine patch superfamily enzyme